MGRLQLLYSSHTRARIRPATGFDWGVADPADGGRWGSAGILQLPGPIIKIEFIYIMLS